MVTIRRDHPGEEVRNSHISFIQANWKTLAIAAYRYYLAQGRGMVMIDEADFMNRTRGKLIRYQTTYIPKSSKDYPLVMAEKESEWVRCYDPALTLLIGIVREDGGFSSYRLNAANSNGTPKTLYEG